MNWRTLGTLVLVLGAAAVLMAPHYGDGPIVNGYPAYLELRIAGDLVDGDSDVVSMERENKIVCYGFSHGVAVPFDADTGSVRGGRRHEPIRCRKRADRSSPLLLRAVAQNEPIEGTFRFYRSSPSGDDVLYYRVDVANARISAVRSALGDGGHLVEEVEFVFANITLTYEVTGATHSDSWTTTP